MRYLNKYKNFTNTFSISNTIPARVFNFKRPKWKRVQTSLQKKSNNIKVFLNNSIIKSKYRSWDKLKNYFKEGLLIKNSLVNLFDQSVSLKFFKRGLKYKNFTKLKDHFLFNFIKLNFRLDILLWKLSFFSSSFHASQAIMSGKIFINNKKIYSTNNIFLKEGDVIFIDDFSTRISPFHSELFFSILEVDYYTKTIIFTKDIDSLNFKDLIFFVKTYLSLKKFKDYVRTK